MINGINGFNVNAKLNVGSVSKLQVAELTKAVESDSQTIVSPEAADSEGVVDISQAQTENSDGIKDLLKQLIELLKSVFGGNEEDKNEDTSLNSSFNKKEPSDKQNSFDSHSRRITLKKAAVDRMVANITDEQKACAANNREAIIEYIIFLHPENITIDDVTDEDINRFVVLSWDDIQSGKYPNIKL